MAAITGAILGGIGAATSAAGAIASAVGANSRNPQFQMEAEKDFEKQGRLNAEQGLAGYRSALGNEVAAGSAAQMDLAGMLKRYAETGAIPDAQDIQRSQAYAQSQFAPQQVAMQQAFREQLTGANRQAALSGRGVNDPILRAKLAQEQTRQNALLQAQQGAFASQFAQQQPFQRLGFMSQRADTLVNRGQLALGNNANLAQLGLAAQNQGYNQRYDMAATQYNVQANQRSEGEKIGSVLGAIGGGISGIGGAIGPALGGMKGGGGGASSAAAAAQAASVAPSAPAARPMAVQSPYNPFQAYAPGATAPGPFAPQGQFRAPYAMSPGPWANPKQGVSINWSDIF